MFVRRKLVNGQPRNYAVWTFREGGKVRQRQIYLGKCPTVAERILDLEEDLRTAQSKVEYYVRKIAERWIPRPYLLEARAASKRRLATVKATLERLNALADEHGLLPTKAARAEREAAKQKREEAMKLYFARRLPGLVVPIPFVSQRAPTENGTEGPGAVLPGPDGATCSAYDDRV